MRATGGLSETAIQGEVLAGADHVTHSKLLVKDAGGSWIDLTDLYGRDFLVGWNVNENVDEPVGTATFDLRREIDRYSLAPLVEGSRVNRTGGTPSGALAPLLKVNREVKLQTSVETFGASPSMWRTLFHGRIVSADLVGDPISLSCQDLGGSLVRRKLKRDRWYGLTHPNADSGCGVWAPGVAFAVGDRIIPATPVDNLAPRSYRCTTAGTTSGTTEPTWPTSGTVSDGTVVWTAESATSKTTLTAAEIVMQAILNDAFKGETVPTLVTPTASSWAIRAYEQSRDGVLDALNSLAAQIGWSVRYVYDGATDAFKLTFASPDRAKSTADAVWSADSLRELNEVSVGIENVRNWIRVVGYDQSILTADGQPTRVEVEAKDTTSITDYGEAFAEVSHTATAQIDTTAELQTLANRVLADLAQPVMSHAASVPFFPWAQLGDVYNFPADGLRYDTTQSLAVIGIAHECSEGVATTSLQCRAAKPVAGATNFWHSKFAGTRAAIRERGEQALANSLSETNLSTSHVVGGGLIKIRETFPNQPPIMGYEVHISTTPGFTPGSSTLVSRGPMRDHALTGLTPGTTYYSRVIPYTMAPRSLGITPGKALPQFSFVAGTVATAMVDNLAITTGKLADLAVTEGKIGSLAITTGKLGDLAVSEAKLGALAVTTGKIAESSVIPSKLDAGSPLVVWDDARGAYIHSRVSSVTSGSSAVGEGGAHWTTISPTASSTDCHIDTDLQFLANRGNAVLVTYRCRSTGWKEDEIFRLYNLGNTIENTTAPMIVDGAWHTAFFDVSSFATTGNLRLDLQDYGTTIGSGAKFDIAYFGFGFAGGGAGSSGAITYKQGAVGVNCAAPRQKMEISGPASDTVSTAVDQGQLVICDEGQSTSALQVGYRWQSGVTEYGLLQARSSGGATNIQIQPAGGGVGIGNATPEGTPRLYVESLNRWDPWSAQVHGDLYVGSSSYGIKAGIATSGGGAGDATIAAQGGTHRLSIGAGTTQAQQQAIQIVSGATTIVQPAWVAASMLNSFQNFDTASYHAAGSFKDSHGVVHLRGLLKRASAALSTAIIQLPSGSRPAKTLIFSTVANNRVARLDIDTNGYLYISAADDASWFNFFSIEGITFDTRS